MTRLFRYFYASDLIAVVGASVSYIAIYWTCAQLLSPAELALLIGGVFLIRFVSSSLIGPWIDRVEPVRLLKSTVLIRFLVLFFVWFLLTQTETTLVPLLVLLVVQTFLQVIGGNTAFKVVTRIVDAEKLPVANAYLSTLDRIGTLAGLLAGGMLIARFSIETILVLEAILHVIAWFLLFPIRSMSVDAVAEKTTYWSDLRAGFRYLLQDARLIRILVFGIIANWMITPANALLAPFAKDVLQGGAHTFSLLELALVIGGIGMSLLYARFADRLDLTQMFRLSILLQGVFTLAVGLTTTLPFAFSGMLLLGMALSLFGIPFATLLQQTTPDALLGRIRSAMVAASTLCSAICFALSSYLTTMFAIETVFVLFSGTGLLATVLLMRFKRTKTHDHVRRDEAG
ncbi:MFS transporter [Exiguobacterium antarcticum]|uniref:MFS transporter n=1 Tax=Exiguobacterium antarcticum TaxID=132920 RepID=A0ABT6R2Z3_9BACL|nr:MFS transporter [Exiguobacterium antarcticum]AFS70425.1 Major facilitator superfamily protein [Exiguobacterium antarcticum B7]MDI3235195.1 MFS transporter [Exiguobacterium antarcticum]